MNHIDLNSPNQFHSLEKLIAGAYTRLPWDFNLADGDSVKEKYEHLMRMIPLLRHVIACNAYQPTYREVASHWLMACPEVAAIFETATSGFRPLSTKEWDAKKGGQIARVGEWRDSWGEGKDEEGGYEIITLYRHADFLKSVILMGRRDNPSPQGCGVILMRNFDI